MTTKNKGMLPDDPPTGEVQQAGQPISAASAKPQSWGEEYDAEERAANISGAIPTAEQAAREAEIANNAKEGTLERIELPTNAGAKRALATKTPDVTPSEQQERFTMSGLAEKLKRDYEVESDAEKALREKREKREKLFAAIGDGIGALSDIYFSSKGAPIVHDPQNSMSERTQARHDKLKAEREQRRGAYLQAYLRQLEQMRKDARQKKLDEYAAADRELKNRELESRIEANRELANYRRTQGTNTQTRAEAYAEGVANANANRDRATTSLVEHRQNQDKNNDARTSAFTAAQNRKGTGGSSRRGSGNRSTEVPRTGRSGGSSSGASATTGTGNAFGIKPKK